MHVCSLEPPSLQTRLRDDSRPWYRTSASRNVRHFGIFCRCPQAVGRGWLANNRVERIVLL